MKVKFLQRFINFLKRNQSPKEELLERRRKRWDIKCKYLSQKY